MKAIVIYNSQTGFTKRYAQWIAEATGADCFELSEAKRKIWLRMKQLFLVAGRAQAVSASSVGLRAISTNGRTKS